MIIALLSILLIWPILIHTKILGGRYYKEIVI